MSHSSGEFENSNPYIWWFVLILNIYDGLFLKKYETILVSTSLFSSGCETMLQWPVKLQEKQYTQQEYMLIIFIFSQAPYDGTYRFTLQGDVKADLFVSYDKNNLVTTSLKSNVSNVWQIRPGWVTP